MKKNIRNKRFLVDNKENLSPHYSTPEEILTLAYEFSDEAILEKEYVEQVRVTLEQFNRFGLANFIYSPGYDDIPIQADCPLDEMSLQKNIRINLPLV